MQNLSELKRMNAKVKKQGSVTAVAYTKSRKYGADDVLSQLLKNEENGYHSPSSAAKPGMVDQEISAYSSQNQIDSLAQMNTMIKLDMQIRKTNSEFSEPADFR